MKAGQPRWKKTGEKKREFVRSTKEERGEQKKKWSAQQSKEKVRETKRKRCCGVDDLVETSSLSPVQHGCCCSCFGAAFLCLPSLPSPLGLIFSLCSMLIIVAKERKLNDDKEGWRGCNYDCRLVRAAACHMEEKFNGRTWVKEC